MRIKKIQIKNFKSLVDFELEDLKPFCAFVGPNASGKSNIFEALEFSNYVFLYSLEALKFFGGKEAVLSYNRKFLSDFPNPKDMVFEFEFASEISLYFDARFSEKELTRFELIGYGDNETALLLLGGIRNKENRNKYIEFRKKRGFRYENEFEQLIDNFSRFFVGKSQLNRINQIQTKLASDASNVSQIIGQIFEDNFKRKDFIEWVRILIPEFKNIEVKKSNIDGSFEFFLYEKSSEKPFPKYLISDGTYNILSLMAAVYQSNQPQFLCIEEPENGLHPHAIQLLIDFFREKCEDEGHHVWLNTHSQTLVRCLEIDEIILVNKINGETKAKQLTKEDNIGIKTDEAWLTNALGGGVLWSK
jgi:predicted ATPase